MTKPRVLVFSKTRWSEPPRLTHQITHLLKNMGYDVIVFEKPSLKFWLTIRKQEGISFVRHFELVHHRLRFFKFLTATNATILKYFIKKTLKKLNVEQAPVINLNYDYYFLKDIFDTNISTIIGDDFVNKLKDGLVKTNTRFQLAKTACNSTYNLAVSYPLKYQLEQFVDEAELFFPWAGQSYKKPEQTNKRDVVLFFGYINYRIDWSIVLGLIGKGVKFRFVGPIEKSVNSKYLKTIRKNPNVELLNAMEINDVDFSDVCCSILPWDVSLEGIQAITINNKCFNLLSRGIPQLYPDLPYLIKTNDLVISKCRTIDEFVERIDFFSENFETCQKHIQQFLNLHYSKSRAEQLEKYLSK